MNKAQGVGSSVLGKQLQMHVDNSKHVGGTG
jgi:hypothetical protein